MKVTLPRLLLYIFLLGALVTDFIGNGWPKKLSDYQSLSLILIGLALVFIVFYELKRNKNLN